MVLTLAQDAESSSAADVDGCLGTCLGTACVDSVVLWFSSDEIPDSSFMLLLDKLEVSPMYFS